MKSKSTVPYTRSPKVKPPSTVSYKAFQKLTVAILTHVYRLPIHTPTLPSDCYTGCFVPFLFSPGNPSLPAYPFFFLGHTILLTIWFSKSTYLISTSTSDSVQKGIGKLQPLLFQTDCKLRNRKYKLQLVIYSGTQDIIGIQQIAFEQNPKLSYV